MFILNRAMVSKYSDAQVVAKSVNTAVPMEREPLFFYDLHHQSLDELSLIHACPASAVLGLGCCRHVHCPAPTPSMFVHFRSVLGNSAYPVWPVPIHAQRPLCLPSFKPGGRPLKRVCLSHQMAV